MRILSYAHMLNVRNRLTWRMLSNLFHTEEQLLLPLAKKVWSIASLFHFQETGLDILSQLVRYQYRKPDETHIPVLYILLVVAQIDQSWLLRN